MLLFRNFHRPAIRQTILVCFENDFTCHLLSNLYAPAQRQNKFMVVESGEYIYLRTYYPSVDRGEPTPSSVQLTKPLQQAVNSQLPKSENNIFNYWSSIVQYFDCSMFVHIPQPSLRNQA
jgi:hypothetical protein